MSKLKSKERKSAILGAAKVLFLENGYTRTSLQMIINESGGSRRSIYEHFGDKETLFRAVMLDVFSQGSSLIENVKLQGSPELVLTGIGEALLSGLVSNPAGNAYRHLLVDALEFPDIGKLVFESGPAVAQNALSQYLKDCAKKGDLVVKHAEIDARLFLEMIQGGYQLKSLIDENFTMDKTAVRKHVKEVVRIFLYGAPINTN